MAHHHHDHDHSEGNIKVAFFLNAGFAIIELVRGLLTNSLAILSDALHDLGDSLSLGLSWYFQKISKKGRTKNFSYGYKRFSLLAAIINSIVLVTGSVIIIIYAIPKLITPTETNTQGMLLLAVLGIAVNGVAALRLKKGKSFNEKVVSLHLLEDVLGWVAILIGSLIMMFFDAPFIDPLLSIVIALFVLYNVYKNLKKSLPIILQGIPDSISIGTIQQQIKELPEIADVHDSHAWSMDGQFHVFTIHIVLKKDYRLSELSDIKLKVKGIIKNAGINHATIEFENVDEHCLLEDC
jgi:cobalt-zinc-cadmium efflux system protein